ncbi:MAG: extracellular solute-binding protein [Christensenellaceae bacterium]|nr:extracellular solute-binding protein [Christensenellaceae bacterium]
MKKTLVMLTVFALLVSMTVLCGFAEAPVEVELWTLFTGPDGVTMSSIVDKYNTSQGKYKVNHIAIDRENLYTKLALAMTTPDDLPDFFVTYSYDSARFDKLGYIKPMEEILEKYEEFDFAIDKYHDACANLNYANGKRMSVSLDFPTWGMYVNNTLAEKYCPNVLEDKILTWDEIKTVGAKLQADGIEDIKVLGGGWARNDLLATYINFAPTYVADDGETLALDKDAVEKMIDLWKECYDAGYLWEEGDDVYAMFACDELIFFTNGTWSLNAIDEYGLDYSFIASPQLNADVEPVLFGASHAFMVVNKETSDDEAKAMASFMHYFYENSIEWARAGSIVASKITAMSDEYQAMPQAFVSNNYSISNPNYVYSQTLFDVLDGLGWDGVYGNISSADFADTWEKQTIEKVSAQQ